MEVFIEQPQPWSNSVRVHIKDHDCIAQPIEFVKPEITGLYHEPAFSLQFEQAQQFMDALWQAGFKPSEGTGSAGALKATQDHLKDMRELVFKDDK